jgi:hypothetical protein
MRYHSIALRGARQIRKFLALLELPAPSQNQKGRKGMKHKLFLRILDPTIHVSHLFIADCAEDRWANQETLIIAISAQSRPLLMDMDLQSWRELVSSNQSVYKKIQVLEADERYMMAVYTMIGLIRSKDARSVGRKGPL